jgi:hypothetical protein
VAVHVDNRQNNWERKRSLVFQKSVRKEQSTTQDKNGKKSTRDKTRPTQDQLKTGREHLRPIKIRAGPIENNQARPTMQRK